MAGILIYTAASDSEGTLGGLVQLGQPVTLGRQIQHALESMRICASDPLCAEHAPVADGSTSMARAAMRACSPPRRRANAATGSSIAPSCRQRSPLGPPSSSRLLNAQW